MVVYHPDYENWTWEERRDWDRASARRVNIICGIWAAIALCSAVLVIAGLS